MVAKIINLRMYFDFIKHNDCSEKHLREICTLKKQQWNYPINKQIEWINNNISENDVHLVLKKDNNLIGYLSLSPIEIEIDNKKINAFGIGSVCVDKSLKGQNFGFLLMKLSEYYLSKNNEIGILLCKKELAAFYEKCKWIQFDGSVLTNKGPFEQILFCSEKITSTKIKLPKLF